MIDPNVEISIIDLCKGLSELNARNRLDPDGDRCIVELAGGNIDDAYDMGFDDGWSDGESNLAAAILSLMGVKE